MKIREKITIGLLLLSCCSAAFSGVDKLTPEEIDNLYYRLDNGMGFTEKELEALNESKVTMRFERLTPIYSQPSKDSRIVDYAGPNNFYTWRCYPAKKGSQWIRCASDEFIHFE